MTGSAITLTLTLLAYLVGGALLGANLFLRRPQYLRAGRTLAILGAILHMGAIGLRCVELHRAPFTTPAESLSLLAWSVALAYLVSEALWRLWVAGPFALGLSFLLIILAAALGQTAPMANRYEELLASGAISLHIIAIVAAIAAFALAFCCAAFYLIENRILKSKHGLTWMQRLPPLRTVEIAAFTLVAVGFPLLTLGILSGLLRAAAGGMSAGWQLDPKALLSYAVWLIYGVYLVARLALNWPPVRTAYVLLLGLPLCLLMFLVPSATHRFG